MSDRTKKRKLRSERKGAIVKAKEEAFWRVRNERRKRDDYCENICIELHTSYL